MQTNIIINYNLQFSIYDFAFVIRSLGSRQCRHILQMESSEFLHLIYKMILQRLNTVTCKEVNPIGG